MEKKLQKLKVKKQLKTVLPQGTKADIARSTVSKLKNMYKYKWS